MSSSSTAVPPAVAALPADLDAGLRRLKLATVRRTAAEVLQTAKTQRWTPEEVLRTLIEAELAARDASNIAARLKAAAFPVAKTLDSFIVAESSIPPATFDYLIGLEWVRSHANLALVGPPGTGKIPHPDRVGDRGRARRAQGPLFHRRRPRRSPLPRPGRHSPEHYVQGAPPPSARPSTRCCGQI